MMYVCCSYINVFVHVCDVYYFVCVCYVPTDDSSRVVLQNCPGVDGSDYINASHVDVSL